MDTAWRPAPAVLSISSGEVHIWRIRLDRWCDHLERLNGLLSDEEIERAARFRFDRDRRRFSVQRALLRLILAGYLHTSPRRLAFELLPAGKPTVRSNTGLEFNSSDSGELGVIAAVLGASLGIDIEQVRADMDHLQVAERFFSPHERQALQNLPAMQRSQAFFLGWTRKEAYIKALGGGLSLPLDRFDVTLVPDEPARLFAARDGLPGPEVWQIINLEAGFGCAGAVCLPVGNWDLHLWDLEPGWIEARRFD